MQFQKDVLIRGGRGCCQGQGNERVGGEVAQVRSNADADVMSSWSQK